MPRSVGTTRPAAQPGNAVITHASMAMYYASLGP